MDASAHWQLERQHTVMAAAMQQCAAPQLLRTAARYKATQGLQRLANKQHCLRSAGVSGGTCNGSSRQPSPCPVDTHQPPAEVVLRSTAVHSELLTGFR